MRGDHVCAGNFQHHLQQMLHIQTKNGPSVGIEIADGGQPDAQFFRRVKIRNVDKTVYLAHRSVLFVNGADFRFQHEARRRGRHSRERGDFPFHVICPERLFQAVKPALLVRLQSFAQFLPPCGMREIAGGQQVYPLGPRPCRQMRHGKPPAGRPGKTGMNMQIGAPGFHQKFLYGLKTPLSGGKTPSFPF